MTDKPRIRIPWILVTSVAPPADVNASAVTAPFQPRAVAGASNSVSPDARNSLCPRGESEPSVTLVWASGESKSCGGAESRSAPIGPQASAQRRSKELIGEAGVAPGPQEAICIDPSPCGSISVSNTDKQYFISNSQFVPTPHEYTPVAAAALHGEVLSWQ